MLLIKIRRIDQDPIRANRCAGDEDREIFVLEANPNCYLGSGSEFAKAAQAADIGFEVLIGRMEL